MLNNTHIRAEAKLTITVLNELAIGNSAGLESDEADDFSVKCVSKGAAGFPFLPASSIKGVIRALLAASDTFSQQDIQHLMGHDKAVADNEAQRGVLLIGQGISRDASVVTRTYNSIDEVTGAAKQNHLYTVEKVAVGSTFNLTLKAKLVDRHCWQTLLSILHEAQLNLGSRRANDAGLVAVNVKTSRVMQAESLARWFAPQSTNKAKSGFHGEAFMAEDGLSLQAEAIVSHPAADTAASMQTFSFLIRSPDPLLIHDPRELQYRCARAGKDERTPDLVAYRDSTGQPLLPATSLRGALRARYRKIVRTLLMQQQPDLADTAVEQKVNEFCAPLLGDTGQRSRISLTNGVHQGKAMLHQQSFIAIDRFTGGVEKGAMLDVEAWETEAFSWQFKLHKQLFSHNYDAQRAILLMLLRDMIEGDIVIGAKKNAGFGQLFFESLSVATKAAQPWQAQPWCEALNIDINTIDQTITTALQQCSNIREDVL